MFKPLPTQVTNFTYFPDTFILHCVCFHHHHTHIKLGGGNSNRKNNLNNTNKAPNHQKSRFPPSNSSALQPFSHLLLKGYNVKLDIDIPM